MFRIVMLWVAGLVTVVPYGIYTLLFHAERENYALLITLVLFWIFGFWGVVGPLLAAQRAYRILKALELARDPEQVRTILASAEAKEAAIDLVASENRIPRFLARRVVDVALRRLNPDPARPITP